MSTQHIRTAAGVLPREDQIGEELIEGVGALASLTIIVARQRE